MDKKEKTDKQKKVEELRQKLAEAHGTSNYYFYLKNNIDTQQNRGM